MNGARRPVCFVAAAAIGIVVSRAEPAASEEACDAWDVEYTTAGTLGIRDTRMGAGDGDHAVGPGSLTLRFESPLGPGPGPVKMVGYSMREFFTVEAKALFWNTKVVTDTTTTAAGDACGVVAEGTLAKTRLGWSTKVRGYKTDGWLTCDGSMCGKFGAPPQGKNEYHAPPGEVSFASFEMAPDLKTFTMTASMVSKSDSPKQTTYLTLAGREGKRTCAHAKPCAKK